MLKLQKPILVGGLGLTASLWLLDIVQGPALDLQGFGWTGLLALGAGAWWLRQRSQPVPVLEITPPRITRSIVEAAIAKAEVTLQQLSQEVSAEQMLLLTPLWERLGGLRTEVDRPGLRLAVVGGPAVGKTTLVQTLAQRWQPAGIPKLLLSDTHALFTQTLSQAQEKESQQWSVPQSVLESDVLLFVVAGDLTETEWQCLQWLQPRVKRLVVVLNKQDLYSPEDRMTLLTQVRSRVKTVVDPGSVVAITAQPTMIQVRPLTHTILAASTGLMAGTDPAQTGSAAGLQHRAESRMTEQMIAPQLTLLFDRLNQILVQAEPLEQMIWETVQHSAQQLQVDAKALLNQVRYQRAMAIVERSQWIAAGTAFVNPLPSLDLLASLAINGQLIVDVAQVYNQSFSLEQGKTAAIALGEMTVKLGLVELSTQALGVLLKSNTMTFLAGGLMQGASAAYLTRLVGLSLVEYFQELEVVGVSATEPVAIARLQDIMQRVFQSQSRTNLLGGLVQQVQQRFALPASNAIKVEAKAEVQPPVAIEMES